MDTTFGTEVYHDPSGSIAAIVMRSEFNPDGIEFLTPLDHPFQLGAMSRPAGYSVEPHEHVVKERIINHTNEVLFVRSGQLLIVLYDKNRSEYQRFEVRALDAVLLSAGGHGVEFLEDSVVIEVKQGPYSGDTDKARFEGITRSEPS